VDQSICSNNYSSVAVNGTIQFATGGIWSSLGTGSFQQATTVLTNTYVPTPADVASGSVILVLTSTGNGTCSAVTDSMLITFTPAPVVNAGTDIPVCLGSVTAVLNGTVSGGATTGQWSTLGTGIFSPNNTTLNATYNLSNADTAAGGVFLVLTSTNFGNCVAVTDTVHITMTPAPIVSAGNDITVCANNDTVALSGSVSSGATTGYWSTSGTGIFIPDSSVLNASYVPSPADTAAGSITLTLTSTNGCRVVSDSLVVTITNAPVVNAGADIGICGSTSVSLNGTVSGAATGGQWSSSGNGSFLPDNITLNPTYLIGTNDTGIVTIVLTSTGNGQCLAVTDTMKILIGKTPTAGFTSSQICTGQLVTFTDTSVLGNVNDSIVSWNWTIGGANDTVQNPTHTYTTSGTDSVTLIIITNTGCTDTVMHVVNIHPSPTAAFTYTVDCTVDSVYFTSTSSIPSGTITSWSWNFGDGNNSAVQNPVHSYTTAGTYTVSLTVTSDSGCTATFSDTVSGCVSVQAGFTSSSSICAGLSLAFTDTSVISGVDSIATWHWNFGDGGTDTVQNPSHTYASAGTYTVSLAIATISGAIDTAYSTILVNPTPQASFTALSICGLDSVYFTDASTITGGTITSWSWNFGDGNTSIVQNPVHYYDSTGAYIVSLTVTSDSGCTATFIDTITSAKGITAAFTDTADCQFNVAFADTSLMSSGDSLVAWIWTFGDGNSDTLQNPVHTYTTSGTYTVQLIVTSSGGCMDTVVNTVTLVPLPVADYIPAGGTYYQGVPIDFSDASSNAASWSWTFGDGSASDTIQNPTHTYGSNGMMNVVLIVMNSSGCPDTVNYNFKIYPNTVGVPGAFSPNNDGINDHLHVLGGPMKDMDWRIYNEWGNEIFHSTDQNDGGWDGTYKGKPQPATRYVYILKGTTVSGDVIDMNGETTIMR
jgi:gliding motility-associated-like protein